VTHPAHSRQLRRSAHLILRDQLQKNQEIKEIHSPVVIEICRSFARAPLRQQEWKIIAVSATVAVE